MCSESYKVRLTAVGILFICWWLQCQEGFGKKREKVNTTLLSIKLEEFALDRVLRQIKQLFTCFSPYFSFFLFLQQCKLLFIVSLHIKLIRILGSNYFLLQHPFSTVAQQFALEIRVTSSFFEIIFPRKKGFSSESFQSENTLVFFLKKDACVILTI